MATVNDSLLEKPGVKELLEVLGQCGQVVSAFLKPTPSVRPLFQEDHPLVDLFDSKAFQEAAFSLGQVSSTLGRYSTLNRLEFEGSLVSVVLQGGCHRATTGMPVEVARALVLRALEEAFPEPFSDVHVFRLDAEAWCQLTNEATVSTSYVVWQSARGLWWVLCVADFD